MKAKDFIGVKASYDEWGTQIWGNNKDGEQQLLLEVRGCGAIHQLHQNKNQTVKFKESEVFQNELGQWFVDAINEKLERERLIEEKELNDKIDEWHNGNSTEPLHKYLGLTTKEYKELVSPKAK